MVSPRRLQQCAVAISVFSILYNAAEGVVSVVFGADSSSRALVFFGIQSVIEVLSASNVTWRFFSSFRQGRETMSEVRTSTELKLERTASTSIGALLIALTLAAIGTSIASLVAHEHPTTSDASPIIAAVSIGSMFLLWLPKRYLARALNSSTMHGEAMCTLSCLQLSVALLIGSLIYREWRGGWWVDSVTAIVIALLFGWEGIKMIRWAMDKDFDGGCCASCS
ncbi:hypothetical protein F5I97DRAFT_1785080, partial [Phlebopus sp. FC_14]